MLQELLARLPQDAGSRALALALCAAAAGLVLWVIGARVSRSVFTLLGVAVGAWVGLRIPRWMGWEIDAMAIAIGAALVLGLAGYLLHMFWVALTLGTLLASAGVFIAWHRLGPGAAWSLPAMDFANPLTQVALELWQSLPGNLSRTMSITAGGCLATGGLIAWRWPKLARVLAFSLLSSAMLVVGGVVAMSLARPEWLQHLPRSTQTQGIAMATLVMVGVVIQWTLCPRARKPAEPLPGAAEPTQRANFPRDVRDLGSTPLGPLKLKEVRA